MTLEGHDNDIRSICYSPDGKQMVSGGWDETSRRWNLQAGKEIEDTGMVKTFHGYSKGISCIDISKDSMLLASGSDDGTTRIWSLDTGRLMAGPFESTHWVGAIRFSQDSKKLAINSHVAATTIYEFDASTLETLGAPFQGHTKVICGLALSFDGALLASTSSDHTIKLWAFESHQLLASFHVPHPCILTLSPNSRQLAYTTWFENKIFICNTPPDVLASIGLAPEDNVRISCIYLSFMW
ncbi:WD40 repeat-like protein [Rhizopogon salebrosus TDB-379]|nr:WD40 repeat-like protein [Rhizopogon salebrosus TDB-379]